MDRSLPEAGSRPPLSRGAASGRRSGSFPKLHDGAKLRVLERRMPHATNVNAHAFEVAELECALRKVRQYLPRGMAGLERTLESSGCRLGLAKLQENSAAKKLGRAAFQSQLATLSRVLPCRL